MKRTLAVLLATTALGACSLTPEPITNAEHFQRAKEDYKELYAGYLPVTKPLTLEEAVARALKYNYDNQLARVETNLQERQLDLALSQMLPRLAADAGYNWRSNNGSSQSISEITRQQSLDYSYSQERQHTTADLQFSWSMLDLGVSYFQARQQGYRAFVAVERRRKVINTLVKETRGAYWKAVSAQRLLPKLEPILAQAEGALAASRKAQADALQPPLQALEYQQNLLQVISQLKRIRTDLVSAKAQLAALINVPPTSELALATLGDDVQAPSPIQVDMARLEEVSLAMRPELREEAYQERIDRQAVHKEMVKMMPGVTFMASLNQDSNKYLYRDAWAEAGVRASYNLVNLIQGPQAIEAAEAAVEVSKTRRLAVSVAVLTQVNLAYQQYLRSIETLETAADVDKVQRQISRTVADANLANAQSDMERIRRFLTATAAELERDRALSDMHQSLGNLYAAVGIDLVPPTVDTNDLGKLVGAVSAAIHDWESGHMPLPEIPAAAADAPSAQPAS
ncbi:MAG: TolC family protein [Magnetospirillum sp.]|nr:TolC family protein [Magnetospirillum sp.]